MASAAREPVLIEMPAFSETWDAETIDLAYQESLPVQELQSQWSDAVDTKVIALFAAGSVLVTLVPTLHRPVAGLPSVLWCVAGVCWVLAAGMCCFAFPSSRP
jgi:hypothetical protein